MNVIKTAVEILSKSISKRRFENRINFGEEVDKFISSIQSNHVRLKLRKIDFRGDEKKLPYQYWKIEFEIIFVFKDPYIDNKVYESGSVYIFPSEKLYNDINKTSMSIFEAYPQWNSTKTIATLTGKARMYGQENN
jgi:hypothetical protein